MLHHVQTFLYFFIPAVGLLAIAYAAFGPHTEGD